MQEQLPMMLAVVAILLLLGIIHNADESMYLYKAVLKKLFVTEPNLPKEKWDNFRNLWESRRETCKL